MAHLPLRASLFAASLMSVTLAAPVFAEEAAETADTTEAATEAPVITRDTVVATVNGEAITLGHVVAAKSALPAQYQQLPNEVLLPGLVDQLVQQTVLSQAIAEVNPVVDIQLDNERRSLVAASKIEEVIADAATEEALAAAYDAKYTGAEPTTEWNASHILVETEAQAADLVEKAMEKDADFAALAKEFSTGPSGPNGGELGWFSAGMMVEPFETAVAGMEAGDVAGPVQTQFGYHVIRLNETRMKGAPPLDEVRDELIAELQTSAVDEAVAALVAAATIEQVDIEAIDPEVLSDPSFFD